MQLRPLVVCALSACTAACTVPMPTCAGAVTDLCRKMRDIDAALGIQVADGVAAAGASQLATTPPGLGKTSVALRASFVPMSVPRFDKVAVRTDGTASASVFPADDGTAMALTAEIAVGIWRGARVQQTRIGGIDLFGNVTLLRDAVAGGVRLSTPGVPGFGLGARVTLFQETDDVPGLSLMLAHRQSPDMTVRGVAPGVVSGDSTEFRMDEFRVNVTGWQLAASKRFNRIGLRGGIGSDRYLIASRNTAWTSGSSGYGGSELHTVAITRSNAFLGASLNLRVATLVGEIGQHFGGDAGTMLNTFAGGSPTASRGYFTLGVRIGDRDPVVEVANARRQGAGMSVPSSMRPTVTR